MLSAGDAADTVGVVSKAKLPVGVANIVAATTRTGKTFWNGKDFLECILQLHFLNSLVNLVLSRKLLKNSRDGNTFTQIFMNFCLVVCCFIVPAAVR